MRISVFSGGALIAASLISGCGNHAAEIDACWERGVAYFKDIGSYPNLQSAENQGKRATDVAWERCKRNTNAF